VTVHLPRGRYISDPGFGGPACLAPLPLTGERVGRHRIVRDGTWWVLEDGDAPAWYSTLSEDFPTDFEVGNHYVATHPTSPFVRFIMMSSFTRNGRVSVMNRDVKIIEGDATHTFQLADRAALRALLLEHFGFDLPEVETMPVPAIPEWS